MSEIKLPSYKIYGVRQRFKLRKSFLKNISSTKFDRKQDTRRFAVVSIADEDIEGLLDSGANITCLGKGGLEFLNSIGSTIIPFHTSVSTANGSSVPIIGRVRCDITFKGVTRSVMVFVAPKLTQKLYLGADFFDSFKLWPTCISELNSAVIDDGNSHALSPEEELTLKNIVMEFPSFEVRGLGKTNLVEHKIDTGNADPVKQRHYPYSPAVQKLVYAEVERMMEMGVVEKTNSPWNSPVCLVRKPGKNRLCLDSRKVNSLTVKDAYPLPHIEGLLSRLEDTHYISSVDLKDAFWQVPLEQSSRPKTAFTIPGLGHFQFTRMPFGLCNAPQTLSKLMDQIFPHELRSNIFIYLDDLLIVSNDLPTHFKLLKITAKKLCDANLTINVKKSHFCFKSLRYLGYIVGGGELRTDPDKVKSVAQFPVPTSRKQVRRFLGMTGWYRRFIPNYANLAAPLTDTLKISPKFQVKDDALKAFEVLKKSLISAPILSHPDFSKPFYIQCDASTSGVGGVLFQVDDLGREKVLYYHSQKLNAAQKNYSITELECMAAIICVKEFRPFIEMQDFTIITDHASLQWLMNQKELSGRLARWSLKLQGYCFKIEHRKGSENVVPDTLSRMYEVDAITTEEVAWFTTVDLSDPAFQSPEYLDIISTIENSPSKLPDLTVQNNFVYKKSWASESGLDNPWKLWIPSSLTENLIKKAHDPPQAAHGGRAKTLYRLRQLFYWPGMVLQVRQFCDRCDVCKSTKPPNQILRPPMGQQMKVDRPFQQLYIDLLGPYPLSKDGHMYLFVCLDNLTKFVLIKPLKTATSTHIINYLTKEVFAIFGTPESIYSDNGKQFVSTIFLKMLDDYGIRPLNPPYYSPQSNASERVNRSIIAAIRSYLKDDHKEWDRYIHHIAASLRSSVHQAIQTSPFQALFGLGMVQHASHYNILKKLNCVNENMGTEPLSTSDKIQFVHAQLKENLEKAHKQYEKQYNLRCKPVSFQKGQEVFKRNFTLSDKGKNINSKFCRKFVKCRIRDVIGSNRYELEDLKGMKSLGIFHAKDIRA